MDGDAEARVTLVTVVSVDGRPDCPLGELPSGAGDLESGADVGIEAVRGLQVVGESGRSWARLRSAWVLLDRRRSWTKSRRSCC